MAIERCDVCNSYHEIERHELPGDFSVRTCPKVPENEMWAADWQRIPDPGSYVKVTNLGNLGVGKGE